MASDAGIGDIEVGTLDVQPGDGTTAGTLTVTAPEGGTNQTPNVVAGTPSDGVVTLTSEAITYDAAGWWVLHWEVTGTGASAEDVRVFVVESPVAGGPTWTPGRSRVANYVFGRTLSRDAETHENTFSSSTMPTGIQCDRLIADAVATILARTGEVNASLGEAAAVVAAKLTACSIERSYPAQQGEQSLQRAEAICKDAARSLEDLVRANQTPGTQGTALLPLYSFPPAPSWGDETFL